MKSEPRGYAIIELNTMNTNKDDFEAILVSKLNKMNKRWNNNRKDNIMIRKAIEELVMGTLEFVLKAE